MGIYKLVGGPRDGCTYEIPDNRTYWQVPIPLPAPMRFDESESAPLDAHTAMAGYTRTVIHFASGKGEPDRSEKVVCYRFDRFTEARCFEHMIETWNPLPVNHNLHHALKAFAAAAGHGDEEHREWLAQAAEDFINNRPIDRPTGMDPKQMSARMRLQSYIMGDMANAMRFILVEMAAVNAQQASGPGLRASRAAAEALERMEEALREAQPQLPATPNPEDDEDEAD